MAVPSNRVQQQGLGAVNADDSNTYQQTVLNIAALRDFIGLTYMTVYLLGYVTPGDGGQGQFVYIASSTAADDGINVVRPVGQTTGAWLRQAGTASRALIMSGFYNGANPPASNYLIDAWVFPAPVNVPANFLGSFLTMLPGDRPTAPVVIIVNLVDLVGTVTPVGTITVGTNGFAVFATISPSGFSALKDYSLMMVAPSSTDATFNRFWYNVIALLQ